MDSQLRPLYPTSDFADAFAITLPPSATRDIVKLAQALLDSPAPFLQHLMKLRDAGVRIFGVKTSRQIREELDREDCDRINFFRVRSVSKRELILGEDDKHLDFRASVLLRPCEGGAGDEIVATSVAHSHNLFGRSYLALVCPFHRMIVRSNLRRAAKGEWQEPVNAARRGSKTNPLP
jgi:hypothetical protein